MESETSEMKEFKAEARGIVELITSTISINELEVGRPRPIFLNWTITISNGPQILTRLFVFSWKTTDSIVAALVRGILVENGVKSTQTDKQLNNDHHYITVSYHR